MNNNKLIAKFDELIFNKDNSGILMKGRYGKQGYWSFDMLEYDSSWDWLMPVIKKAYKPAEDMEAEEWCCSIQDRVGLFDITSAYNELVEFIEWYNSQS